MNGSRGVLALLCLMGVIAVPVGMRSITQMPGPQRPPMIIPSLSGMDLYGFYCASCHGRDAKGHGPTAPALNVLPPDLTTLAARNHGTFPKAAVESYVTGNREPVPAAHGSKDMPVWGPIFRALDTNDAANRVRIENIVGYIESIQIK